MNTTVVIFTNKNNMQYYQTQYITQIHSTLTITTILLLKTSSSWYESWLSMSCPFISPFVTKNVLQVNKRMPHVKNWNKNWISLEYIYVERKIWKVIHYNKWSMHNLYFRFYLMHETKKQYINRIWVFTPSCCAFQYV